MDRLAAVLGAAEVVGLEAPMGNERRRWDSWFAELGPWA